MRLTGPSRLAYPKSVILRYPRASSNRFSGFKSLGVRAPPAQNKRRNPFSLLLFSFRHLSSRATKIPALLIIFPAPARRLLDERRMPVIRNTQRARHARLGHSESPARDDDDDDDCRVTPYLCTTFVACRYSTANQSRARSCVATALCFIENTCFSLFRALWHFLKTKN